MLTNTQEDLRVFHFKINTSKINKPELIERQLYIMNDFLKRRYKLKELENCTFHYHDDDLPKAKVTCKMMYKTN